MMIKNILALTQTHHPIWAMAFRPLYILASLFGVLAILLWGFGYTGTAALPGLYWHAHEMIWGYAGTVVVGFLLTAVATWTAQPPTRGAKLMLLTLLWLTARITAFIAPLTIISAITGTLFFWVATAYLARPMITTKNRRNYIAILALFLLGITHAIFHWQLAQHHFSQVSAALHGGLIMITGFIGLIGMRVIPFFTARRLNIPQVQVAQPIILSSIILPIIMTINWIYWPTYPLPLAIAGIISGCLNLWQLIRWWHRNVLTEPLLWILFLGFGFCALGLINIGISQWIQHTFSLGIHLIAVGGIGLLTLGMMARTALGHTGRPMRLIKPLPLAFKLMVVATIIRSIAAITSNAWLYTSSIHLSALCFALALILYAWRYIPWLLQPRIDGRMG